MSSDELNCIDAADHTLHNVNHNIMLKKSK